MAAYLTPENKGKFLEEMAQSTASNARELLRTYDSLLRRQARAFSMLPSRSPEEIIENLFPQDQQEENA